MTYITQLSLTFVMYLIPTNCNMETLTKENFWDEMEQKYPKAMAHFKRWIDQYKEENNWYNLFNSGIHKGHAVGFYESNKTEASKYHELPIAMQFGIFVEYSNSVIKAYRLHPSSARMESQDLIFETKQLVEQCFNWLEQKGKLL